MHQKDILKVIKRDNCTSIWFQSNYSVLMVDSFFHQSRLIFIIFHLIFFCRRASVLSKYPMNRIYLSGIISIAFIR